MDGSVKVTEVSEMSPDPSPEPTQFAHAPHRLTHTPEAAPISKSTKSFHDYFAKLSKRLPSVAGRARSRSPLQSKQVVSVARLTKVLGPGQYNVQPLVQTSSFQFSTLPRFPSDLLNMLARKPTTGNPQIMRRNKRMATHKPQAKQQRLELLASARSMKEVLNKQAKNLIQWEKHTQLVSQLQDKDLKCEMRLNKREYSHLRKFWMSFLVINGMSLLVSQKVQEKKQLRRRVTKRVRWLFYTSRIIGKFALALKRAKVTCAYNTLSKLLPPMVRLKMYKLEKKFTLVINSSMNKLKTGVRFSQIMVNWKVQVLRIQRTMHSFFAVKQARLTALRLAWLKQFLETRPLQKLENFHKVFPEPVIVHYCCKFIRRRRAKYLRLRTDRGLSVMKLYTPGLIRKLVSTAENERALWDKLTGTTSEELSQEEVHTKKTKAKKRSKKPKRRTHGKSPEPKVKE